MNGAQEREFSLDSVSLTRSLGFTNLGMHDPTGFCDARGFAKSYLTKNGPVTVHLARIGSDEGPSGEPRPTRLLARAWGPGAEDALGAAPRLAGADDDPRTFDPVTLDMARRAEAQRGLRLVRVPWLFDALVQIVLQQRIRFVEAARAYRAVCKRHGKRAPGPFDLVTSLGPKEWERVPVFELSSLGVDRKRIDAVKNAAKLARHVEKLELLERPAFDEARRILGHFQGIGPWTRESFMGAAMGCPDAVQTGDVHLPRTVCTALGGVSEPYDDARLLEVLEPFRGHRQRVIRLLMSSAGAMRTI